MIFASGNITGGMMSADGICFAKPIWGWWQSTLPEEYRNWWEADCIFNQKWHTQRNSIEAIIFRVMALCFRLMITIWNLIQTSCKSAATDWSLYRKDMDTGDIVHVDTISRQICHPVWGVGEAAISADGNFVVFEHYNSEYTGQSSGQITCLPQEPKNWRQGLSI